MQFNGTAVLDRAEAAQLSAVVSPVIDRSTWAGPADGPEAAENAVRCPITVRIEFPMSPADMVAALYYDRKYANPIDLAADADVWQQAALVLLELGFDVLCCQAGNLAESIARGTVEDPTWLALVQRRVAEVTGGAR